LCINSYFTMLVMLNTIGTLLYLLVHFLHYCLSWLHADQNWGQNDQIPPNIIFTSDAINCTCGTL
jgi:hypothetical protein